MCVRHFLATQEFDLHTPWNLVFLYFGGIFIFSPSLSNTKKKVLYWIPLCGGWYLASAVGDAHNTHRSTTSCAILNSKKKQTQILFSRSAQILPFVCWIYNEPFCYCWFVCLSSALVVTMEWAWRVFTSQFQRIKRGHSHSMHHCQLQRVKVPLLHSHTLTFLSLSLSPSLQINLSSSFADLF